MAELKEVVGRMLLPLQLILGIWQIMKVTPLWAIMICIMKSLFRRFPDTKCNKLLKFKGRVFKKVISHATTAGDVSKGKKQQNSKKSKKEGKSENGGPVSVYYLGKEFELERKEGNKMFVKDGPTYYITDKMWETVLHIIELAPDTVFVKDHKEICEEVVTGDIMEFEEVLDSVILDNRAVIRLDHDYFLPVNLLKSEDKLLKILNLVGLFLHTQKHIHWLIPALLSFTSAVLGFSTRLRVFVACDINKLFCRAVRFLCDQLTLPMRRWVYFWGNSVENLKPCNDLQLKIVKRKICPVVAGGAKVHFESLASWHISFTFMAHPGSICARVPEVAKRAEQEVPDSNRQPGLFDYKFQTYVPDKTFADCESRESSADCSVDPHQTCSKVGPFFFKCDSLYIEWTFDRTHHKCSLKAGVCHEATSLKLHNIVCDDDDDCKREEDIKISTSDCCAVEKHEKGGEYCMSVSCDAYCGADENNRLFIMDHIDTASIDVDCSSKEAIKLFKLAFYMAEQKSGSLKSYDSNANIVCVRGFLESINAYVRSGYPPLYKLDKLENVVVL